MRSEIQTHYILYINHGKHHSHTTVIFKGIKCGDHLPHDKDSINQSWAGGLALRHKCLLAQVQGHEFDKSKLFMNIIMMIIVSTSLFEHRLFLYHILPEEERAG